ncbi:uncharacterized protein BX663DRAFT_489759 [Cokeromyces recurvatus]|uniref:uncharacterized protein n=1 Tax=Cokeromyces recurvatus TaxID=90255 RepID=UPI00221F6E24|nr:uncharacterized protein BX663DRAFT_489759 [Cokeromyces recurvatus]KAI7898814.1 hypothetical protein BX663DRAFT_489759 [Cokeromyces recurvatus]
MASNLTLSLEEDNKKICEIVDDYLEKHTISEWKYEAALKALVDKGLVIEPTNINLEKLGRIYLKECLNKYQDRITNCNTEDKEKIESLQHSIHKICTSTPIKKLLNVARYASQFLDEAVINRTQQNQGLQDQQATQASISNILDNLSPNERMRFFSDKFGVDGCLDLMEDKVANRFKRYLKESIADLKLNLQPMITKKEREMLMNIAECKSRMDTDSLLASFYAQKNMDPLCRYIRLAFATVAELWSSSLLLKADHNESWFRIHVYSAVFDNAFIYDDKFTTKRTDCYSNITKEFEDVDNQRVDFILRNINDDNDYLSTEEKPNLKEGKALQKAMLRKWTSRLGSTEIMKQLEAITCQWKDTFSVPKNENHTASFAHVLAAVLSLRRLVYLNYTKLNTILEAKYAHELEKMYFSSDNELYFRSDSSADEEQQEEIKTNSHKTIDPELETNIIQALCNIKSEEDYNCSSRLNDFYSNESYMHNKNQVLSLVHYEVFTAEQKKKSTSINSILNDYKLIKVLSTKQLIQSRKCLKRSDL